MSFPALARYADQTGRWAAIALGVSLPISVALDNLLLTLVLLGGLAGGGYREKLQMIRGNPVALAGLALFALLAIGTLYADAHPGDAQQYLGKYLDLALIPLFVVLFRDASNRRHALLALAVTLLVIMLLSLAIKLGALPSVRWVRGNTDNPIVFKPYLTHSILLAFGAFLFLQMAWAALTPRMRWFWLACAVLAVIDLMLVKGRTGYLVLVLLLLYSGYLWRRWAGFAGAGLGLFLLGSTAYFSSALVPERVQQVFNEYRAWTPGAPVSETDSIGARLEFYTNSVAIVRAHPLIGVGTGGFSKAYAEQVRGKNMLESRNPHNEYLLITVQLGLPGLILLFILLYQQWRLAPQLATPLETYLARGLVITIAGGCMFNSLLLDHTEGLLYAWLTGLLYGGLKSADSEKDPPA